MIAVEMLPMLEREAKDRQRAAGKLYGENHPKQEVGINRCEALMTEPRGTHANRAE